jgi:hypothetical protein
MHGKEIRTIQDSLLWNEYMNKGLSLRGIVSQCHGDLQLTIKHEINIKPC